MPIQRECRLRRRDVRSSTSRPWLTPAALAPYSTKPMFEPPKMFVNCRFEMSVAKLIHISAADDVRTARIRGDLYRKRQPTARGRAHTLDSKIRAAEVVKEYRSRGLRIFDDLSRLGVWTMTRAFLPALVSQIRSGLMPNWSPNDLRDVSRLCGRPRRRTIVGGNLCGRQRGFPDARRHIGHRDEGIFASRSRPISTSAIERLHGPVPIHVPLGTDVPSPGPIGSGEDAVADDNRREVLRLPVQIFSCEGTCGCARLVAAHVVHGRHGSCPAVVFQET